MRLTQMACDADACDARFPTNPAPRLDWRDARRDGWETRGEQDFCPAHSALDDVRRLAAAGMSDAGIGAEIGRSRSFVQQLRQRHDIPGQPPGRPPLMGRCAERPAVPAMTWHAGGE